MTFTIPTPQGEVFYTRGLPRSVLKSAFKILRQGKERRGFIVQCVADDLFPSFWKKRRTARFMRNAEQFRR